VTDEARVDAGTLSRASLSDGHGGVPPACPSDRRAAAWCGTSSGRRPLRRGSIADNSVSSHGWCVCQASPMSLANHIGDDQVAGPEFRRQRAGDAEADEAGRALGDQAVDLAARLARLASVLTQARPFRSFASDLRPVTTPSTGCHIPCRTVVALPRFRLR
jgi:hypothetical protein